MGFRLVKDAALRSFCQACSCFSATALAKPAKWIKQQPTVEGKNQDVIKNRFRLYEGTVAEALNIVCTTYRQVELHKVDDIMIRRQFHLTNETFDEETEVVVNADASSAMTLGAGYRVVCESDAT